MENGSKDDYGVPTRPRPGLKSNKRNAFQTGAKTSQQKFF
jgi:hypothetical protein